MAAFSQFQDGSKDLRTVFPAKSFTMPRFARAFKYCNPDSHAPNSESELKKSV